MFTSSTHYIHFCFILCGLRRTRKERKNQLIHHTHTHTHTMKSAATTMCSYGTILVSFVVVIAFITTTTEGVYSQETPMPSTCDCGTKYCVAGPAPVFTLMKGSDSVGNGDFDATPQGPVGYGPGGSLTAAPIECLEVTPASFVVNPCGVVAPHNHANTAEVNTVISGEGVVCVLPEMEAASGAPDLQCYQAEAGDSFIFPKGLVHNWINVDKEYQFVTVTTFPDSDSPDAASMMTTPAGTTLQDSIAAGMLGSIVTQSGGSLEDGSTSADAMPMLDGLVGSFGAATGIAAPLPLFPSFDDPASEGDSDSSSDNGSGSGGGFLSGSGRGAGDGFGPSGAGNVSEECKEAIDILSTLGDVPSDQIAAPKKYKLATPREMSRGVYNVGTDGIGGSIRLITKDAWPWLAEANMSLALYVFSYCGMLNIHVHSKANEWGTVIAGEGYVFQVRLSP